MAFGLSPNFNEPSSDDPTSASQPVNQPVQQPALQAVGQRKKKGFGPNVRNPGALAAAIAKSKRARQSTYKYGQ